jgi:preprotein translocase subunit SecD
MLNFGKWKIFLILFLSLLGPIYAFPNLMSESWREWAVDSLPSWTPHQAMSLGLDLQGGSHLQMQVDMKAVESDRLESLQSSVRQTLRNEKILAQRVVLNDGKVSVAVTSDKKDAALTALQKDLGMGVRVTSQGDELIAAYTDVEMANFKKQAIGQSIEIIRRRIDETGTKEPLIQAQGEDRIIVQLPGMKDPERVKQLLGKTARMTFHLVDQDVSPTACATGQIPLSSRCLSMADETEGGFQMAIQRRALLKGDNLVDAQPGYDISNRSVVNFRFDSLGARKFAEVTRQNVGKPFAIVLDDKIITAPRINEPILGGQGQISGNFSVQGANDLAILLRAGALPAPLKVVEERTVGPSLGADSIESGKNASIVATILVMGFMIAVYGWRFGMLANIALVVNMLLMIAFLSMIGATLTLPGIVGIVLTIGMAVDANVLIFERIREEIRNGRGIMPSIDLGFQGALSSIMDANMTTLIAAAVLFMIGTGPVRGFAVTLAVGILTSLFASIYLTRLLILAWVQWRQPKTLPL